MKREKCSHENEIGVFQVKGKLLFFLLLTLTLLMTACSGEEGDAKATGGAGGQTIENLPEEMVWSVYDVGAAGYVEVTAVVNELTKDYGVQTRLLPSSSGVGRMQPLKNGVAEYGRLGDESQFAFEANFEFASKEWGPQDLRLVWTPYTSYGMATNEKSAIDSLEDLKGKKVPFIVGNHSVNIKTEAILAFVDLTWEDVEKIELSAYGAQTDALKQGQIDVVSMIPSAPGLYEIESMDGLKWLEMDADDEKGWEKLQVVAPWLVPGKVEEGAGITEEKPVDLIGYGYAVVVYAEQDPEEVYALLKAMDDTYDKWKDSSSGLKGWHKEQIIAEPLGVPMHEGTIKFLEEEGLWTEEYQKKNDELIERATNLSELWEETLKNADEEGVDENDFPAYWSEKKAELN